MNSRTFALMNFHFQEQNVRGTFALNQK